MSSSVLDDGIRLTAAREMHGKAIWRQEIALVVQSDLELIFGMEIYRCLQVVLINQLHLILRDGAGRNRLFDGRQFAVDMVKYLIDGFKA